MLYHTPVITCTSERPFFPLKKIKTYLRLTMEANQLNIHIKYEDVHE